MNQSFTLLELLLTIAVIALICSLALQNYVNAKRRAQIAACQVHKKQVDMLKNMPEYNISKLEPKDIEILVKVYDRCYECHASASIPFYYAQ
jgi:competence protein ComGC|tara:strand:+ start:1259 stop:1534 length:276 start_codon:yes stop_codon:yes gene_type:complete